MLRRPIHPFASTTVASIALLIACGNVPEEKPPDVSAVQTDAVIQDERAQRQAELEAQHQAELARLRAESEKIEREEEEFREYMRQQQVLENDAKAAAIAARKDAELASASAARSAAESEARKVTQVRETEPADLEGARQGPSAEPPKQGESEGCKIAKEQQKHFQERADKDEREYNPLLEEAKRLKILDRDGRLQQVTNYWICTAERGRTILAELNQLKADRDFAVEKAHTYLEKVIEACK